ncbi:hypothetical protein H8697_14405 [[Eubacterium] tenue]|nr:hypothetical protein [[Eubacterium] tenue]MBC8632865.1 hypothetical protein [[Eubacterium] tenue]
MAKDRDEIKKEFNYAKEQFRDVKSLYKEGFKQVKEDQKRKTEEKYNKEREEYAKTKKVNYFSPTCWETMSHEKLKKINIFITCFGIFSIAFGLLFLFGTGDKVSIFIILAGLYFLYFDPRRFTSSYKNNKKH